MPERCDLFESEGWLYLEGSLEGTALADFERHLDECPDCRADLAAAQAVTSALTRLPAPVPEPTVEATILRRAAVVQRESLHRPWWSERRRAVPLLAAAALLLILLGGWDLLRMSEVADRISASYAVNDSSYSGSELDFALFELQDTVEVIHTDIVPPPTEITELAEVPLATEIVIPEYDAPDADFDDAIDQLAYAMDILE